MIDPQLAECFAAVCVGHQLPGVEVEQLPEVEMEVEQLPGVEVEQLPEVEMEVEQLPGVEVEVEVEVGGGGFSSHLMFAAEHR